ncbi:Vitamin B12 transporter BtuB [Oligella sp. MSHR50489EDL]|uniref:TonB-dependent receptor family protein n=1 Tax=Oligella sp. MSHR50489EDL TaxID=3139409 RepID=UPI003D81ACA3
MKHQNAFSSLHLHKSVTLKPLTYALSLIGFSLLSTVAMQSIASAQAQNSAQSSSQSEAQETVQLPAINVRAISGKGLSVPTTPSALEQSYRATIGGSNVIKPNNSGSQATLRDMIGQQPGVTLLDFFGGNDHPVISIRGSGIQSQPMSRGINLLVDGLPLNDADGSFYMGMLEPRNSSIIGVRRGANAINPSSQTLGGEMDFLSYTGETESGSISLQYGTNSTTAGRFAIGRAFDTWDFHVAATDQRTDGFRDHSRQRRQSLRANLGLRGSNWENRTWLSHTYQNFEIPGPLSRDAALGDETYKSTTDNLPMRPLQTDPQRRTESQRLANLTTLYAGSWTHSIGAYVQHTDDRFMTPAQVWEMDLNTLGLQYMADAQFDRLSLGGGLSYSYSSGDFAVSGNPNQPMMPIKQMHRQEYGVKADNFIAQVRGGWEFIPDWTLSAQLRFVHTGRDVHGRVSNLNGLQSLSKSWNWLSPKIALSWEPNDSTLFFANVSTGREAPTLRDMVQFAGPVGALVIGPNGQPMFRRGLTYVRELEPQRNLSYEIGARGLINQQYGWDITLYHADIEKELISYSPDGSNTFVYNYEGDTGHRGVELGLTGHWDLGAAGKIAARIGYTYNDFKFRQGIYAGNDIGGMPRQYLSVNLDYRYRDFSVGLNGRGALGSSYADHANTQKMGSYFILGAHMGYDFNKDSNVYIQVDNITNKRYISWTTTPERGMPNQDMYFPGSGRTVTAGVNFRF